jgi:hypothetical protein
MTKLQIQMNELKVANDYLTGQLMTCSGHSTTSPSGLDMHIFPSKQRISLSYEENIEVINIRSSEFKLFCGTDSMLPTFDCKDAMIVYKPAKDDLRRGDIIIFESDTEGYYIIHRITNVYKRCGNIYVTTKGDNVAEEYGMIKYDKIAYKVVGIIYK